MRKRFGFIVTYIWVFLFLIVGLVTLILGEKEERISESEKRMLAAFPELSAETLLSGDFSTGFEEYLSDGLFFRDRIAGISDTVLGFFSVSTYEDTMLLDGIAMADELAGNVNPDGTPKEEVKNVEPQAPLVSEQPNSQTDVEASPEQSNSPAEAYNGTYGLFLRNPDGTLHLLSAVSEQNIMKVSQTLNTYKSFLPEDGKVFYSCVPLTSYRNVAVESGKYIGWFENLDTKFAEYLADGVYMVSSPNVLNEHLMSEHLFFQADHHWTPRAAWYLVEEMMSIQGVPVVPYDEYEYKVNKFKGIALVPDDLELLYPLQDVQGNQMLYGTEADEAPLILYENNDYVAYLAGDNHTWMKYETGFSTGRSALVIGDSFSNAFIPYLLPYYDQVHRADVRYHNDYTSGGSVSTLIEHYGIDDVYIILSYDNGVDSFISTQTLENLLYEYSG